MPALDTTDTTATTTTKKAAKKASKKKAAKKVKASGGTGSAMLRTLSAMKSGKAMTHDAIAKVTGQPKGNKLRELTAAGLVKTDTEEGTRGFVYTITAKGRSELAKSK